MIYGAIIMLFNTIEGKCERKTGTTGELSRVVYNDVKWEEKDVKKRKAYEADMNSIYDG